MRNLVILSVMALSISACAKRPNAIAPVSMGGAYDSISCQKANTLLSQERQTLAALEQQQRNAANGDAIGVFLVLVPVGSLTGGSVEGELATSKGKVLALENRLTSC